VLLALINARSMLLAAVERPADSSVTIAIYFFGGALLLIGGAGLFLAARIARGQERQLRVLENLSAERRGADQVTVDILRNQLSGDEAQRAANAADSKRIREARALLAEAVVTLDRLKHQG
jgi:hypothetical protein